MKKKIFVVGIIAAALMLPRTISALSHGEQAACMRIFSKILDVQERRAIASTAMDETIEAHRRGEMTLPQYRCKARRWRNLEARLAIKATRLYERADRMGCLDDVSEDAIEFLGE